MVIKKILKAGVASLVLASVIAPGTFIPVAHAQQTTSAIRGVVISETGAPISGAQVVITDTRTGASRTLSTAGDGSFSARNLTTGGPYVVSASGNGLQGQRFEDVYINLNSTTSLTFELSSGATSDEIVVTATRSNAAQLAIGPSSSFGVEELQGLPSISRDIRDVIRLDPRVVIDGANDDNVSCIGGNNRFNSFTIDGTRVADPFGLNASGFPSRNTLPIPFDAVRETSVEFSPFDVEYGQFTGCNINVVTQSGSNEFHGSVFGVFNSSGLTGSTIDGVNVAGDSFRDYNWGASFGGPIIKDKLFFYGSYEEVRDGGDIVNAGPENDGFANPVIGLTRAEVDRVDEILSRVYNLESGGVSRVLPESSRRILGRVDWQINDDHRLEAGYWRLRESNVEPDDLGFDAQFIFGNTFEDEGSEIENYNARLYSQWTENFSTEIRASRLDNQDLQGPVGGGEAQDPNPIPIFRITEDDGNVLQNGPGQFRSANDLRTQIDQIKVKFDYVAGNHVFTGGYEWDQLDVFNLFVINATGIFEFDSIDDLETGLASSITQNGSFSGDINDAGATFARTIHTLYLQDQWQVTDRLGLTIGLRYDLYQSDDRPTESSAFVQRYGFSNSQGFNGLSAIQPRLAFNYDAGTTFFGETQIRGGAGVFSGGDPTVWFSNSFSNTGSNQGFGGTFGAPCTAADLQVVDNGTFTGVPACIVEQQQAQAALGQGRVAAVDPDFRLPTIIRGSLGFTHITDFAGAAGGFFDDWQLDVDFIHSRRRNAPDFVDLTLTPSGIAPDGRFLYNAVDPLLAGCNATFVAPRIGFAGDDAGVQQGGACDAGGDDQDILLTNVDLAGGNGGSTTVSGIFSKGWEFDGFGNNPGRFDFTLGYAYTSARDVNPTTSSTQTSNFEEVAVANINLPQLAPTQFVNAHNLTISARYGQEFIRDYETSVNLFFNARSGRRFSYAYDNNTPTTVFGDSDNEERNLFYVPSGPNDPLVTFAPGFDQAAFFDFLETTGLNEFAGQISPRNAFTSDWFYDLDVRFQQEIPAVRKQDRAFFFVDIENFTNLISDSANIFRTFDNGDVGEAVPVLDAALSADGTQYIYSNFNPGGGNFNPERGVISDIVTNDSLWAIQIGFKYEF